MSDGAVQSYDNDAIDEYAHRRLQSWSYCYQSQSISVEFCKTFDRMPDSLILIQNMFSVATCKPIISL